MEGRGQVKGLQALRQSKDPLQALWNSDSSSEKASVRVRGFTARERPSETTTAYPNGVGKCEGHSKRQTLRNGHDENRDADDEELDELLDVREVPLLIVDGERLDGESQNEYEHGEDGDDGSWHK